MSGLPTTPLLSLCLATYNRAAYLDRYLTHHLGALEAAGIDYELVVSDNASTDETPQILARYAAGNPRVRVSRQPHNVSAYPNILTTLRQARGEVLVSIADDDLMIPETLLGYVQRMVDEPALVMIQAPWLLMDETRDNAVIGKFYDFEGEQRFAAGQYGACLAFLIQHHVFPECWLMRRDIVPAVTGPSPRFTYSYFAMLAHALLKGEVLFSPDPHVAATAVSGASRGQVGNREAMESWDVYRGGLELLASYARQFNPGALPEGPAVGGAIQDFVCERMAVAARLQAHAQNWSSAYEILRRLHAYGITPQIGEAPDDVARLAAVETALLECRQLGASVIVVGEGVPDHVLDRMNAMDGARLIRADALAEGDLRRGFCGVGAPPQGLLRAHDVACDIVSVMDRFPTFPTPAA